MVKQCESVPFLVFERTLKSSLATRTSVGRWNILHPCECFVSMAAAAIWIPEGPGVEA